MLAQNRSCGGRDRRLGSRCRLAFVTAAIAAAVAWSSQAACPIEGARYRMMHDPDVTAGFHRLRHHEELLSDLAIYIRSQRRGVTFWFLFDQGAARYINLISTTNVLAKDWLPPDPDGGVRPLPEMHILLADSDFVFAQEVPKSGEPPPASILLPDLSETLHHNTEPAWDVLTDLFKFDGCASDPPE